MGTGTGIGRVRGLGSAKSGAHHWWLQRLTAIGTLLLATWFIVTLVRLPDLSHESIVTLLSSPLAAVALALMVVSVFWHLRLGLQVFIEDYVHEEANKLAALIALNFYAVGATALALYSILKIALTGEAA